MEKTKVKFERQDIVSNLYETSKSSNGAALLSVEANKYEVYNLDMVKSKFCDYYRHGVDIKSCDAYYYDQYNYLVIEFKNVHHFMLKEYYDEIEMKMLDSHMLLAEIFWKSKKNKDISAKVGMIVVYNDSLNYGNGIRNIADSLNRVVPINGDKTRKSEQPKMFNEEEFVKAMHDTSNKYESEFYKSIEFLDKKDFEKDYIETNYFGKLQEI
jgi:hypothetical protein